MSRSRRRPRARLLLAAIVMLAIATALVIGALISRDTVLVSGASVVAVAGGWCGLRLAWHLVRRERVENASARATLARAQRDEIAAMTAQHSSFVSTMRNRLDQRDRRISHLEETVDGWQLRAVEAESTAADVRRQLDDAEEQIAALETVTAPAPALAPVAEQSAGPEAPLRQVLVPEWARLETEATEALLAWETHAVEVAGRHRQSRVVQRHLKQA